MTLIDPTIFSKRVRFSLHTVRNEPHFILELLERKRPDNSLQIDKDMPNNKIQTEWDRINILKKKLRETTNLKGRARAIVSFAKTGKWGTGLWAYRPTWKRAHGPMSLQAYMKTGSRAYGPTGLQAHGLTGLRAYGPTGIRAYGHTGIRAYGHTGIRT